MFKLISKFTPSELLLIWYISCKESNDAIISIIELVKLSS